MCRATNRLRGRSCCFHSAGRDLFFEGTNLKWGNGRIELKRAAPAKIKTLGPNFQSQVIPVDHEVTCKYLTYDQIDNGPNSTPSDFSGSWIGLSMLSILHYKRIKLYLNKHPTSRSYTQSLFIT